MPALAAEKVYTDRTTGTHFTILSLSRECAVNVSLLQSDCARYFLHGLLSLAARNNKVWRSHHREGKFSIITRYSGETRVCMNRTALGLCHFCTTVINSRYTGKVELYWRATFL